MLRRQAALGNERPPGDRYPRPLCSFFKQIKNDYLINLFIKIAERVLKEEDLRDREKVGCTLCTTIIWLVEE